MAELVAGFLGPAIEVVGWVGAPIMRQFNYLCCFTTNIANLKLEVEELQNAAGDLQEQVERARDDVQLIAREVEAWLIKSNDIKDKSNGILNDATNLESGCLKLRARFSLSKRAKKTTDCIKELRDECNFDVISHPRPPPAKMTTPLGVNTYEFESRKQIEEDIMTSLRGGDVNMIGICGMGGLGKTTTAKIIMNRSSEEHVFQEVVMAVVSQPVDKLKIQNEIGGSLGLDMKGLTSEASRVQKLRARLTASTKRILLVLDDVWETLELEELGIPCGCKGCTILLTSRNRDVLSAMNVEKVFGMKVLSKEEAWFLFRERAGTCVDDTKLISLAKQVVEECKGLPIALTTVGAALKEKNDACIWEDALRQLKQGNPDIPGIIAKVYNPLKLSYDALDSKHAKSVFLLCCLFPEDTNICLKYLTCFCMGLGIFEEIRNLKEARNRIRALIQMLKNRSLLLEGRNEDYVRMHDVVRDVSIFIAQKEGYIRHNDCISSFSSFQLVEERIELPARLRNLRLLFLIRNSVDEQFKLDDTFLEGIRELNVLSIENCSSLTSLPCTTESLKNLNTLVLDSCRRLLTLSAVGKLLNLEILICRDCGSIQELPPEIKGLNCLKLLELTKCPQLQRMGPGIISSLVGLEELKMLDSFKRWGVQERENVNAGLKELEALTNLTSLEIEIVNPAFVVEKMQLSSKLERFQISIHVVADVGLYLLRYCQPQPFIKIMNAEWDGARFDKKMSVCWQGETCLRDWVERLILSDTECLRLRGIDATNVDLAKTQNIRWLEVGECETMKNIGRTSMDDAPVFPFIEYLFLYDLSELEEILDGPISSNSFHNLNELSLQKLPALKQLWKSSRLRQNNYVPVFSNLSSIVISYCHRLPNLGQLSIAGTGCLPQLQILCVSECKMMKQVFLWNEDDENKNSSEIRNRHITKSFPKLKEVQLSYLPNLETLYQGIGGIEFPLLTEMFISLCPKMTSMVSSNENNSRDTSNPDDIDDDHSSHLFCQPQKMSFSSLKKLRTHRNPFCGHKIPAVSSFTGLEMLEIHGYHGSMSLFTSSISGNLVSLKELRIYDCDELVDVIKDDEKVVSSDGQRTLLFPKLQELVLYHLPKLVSFCEWNCDVSCRRMEIDGCSNMKIFNLGSNVSFTGLEELTIVSYDGCMSLFSSSIVRNLVDLKKLKLNSCDKMVKVIEDEKEEENVVSGGAQSTTTILFPKLQELELESLPKLVSFCEWKCDVNCRRLCISSCSNMKIFNLGSNVSFTGLEELTIVSYDGSMSLFSSSIARNLVDLKKLKLNSCDKMVKVIEDEKEEENVVSGGAQSKTTILFPKLQELELESLPKLVSFCEWKCDLSCRRLCISSCSNYMIKIFNLGSNVSFSGLEELTIKSYDSSMSLFSSSIARNLVGLKKLYIYSCNEMVKVIEVEKEQENVVSGGAQSTTTILFPKLQELELVRLPKLVSFCEWKCDVNCWRLCISSCSNYMIKIFNLGSNVSFSGLEDLAIESYHGSMSLFSSSIARNLVDLKKLYIYSCNEMVKVIEDEKEEENVVSGGAQSTPTILFPKLQELHLYHLPKLVSFCEWNCDVNCRRVEIDGCSNMKIFNLGSNVSFSGLEELTIRSYHGSMSLFSSSIARNLVDLKQLVISYCDEMVKLIEDEKEEENAVSGGAQSTTTILFPKLQELQLKSLPKLVSFCEWKCDVELPSLTKVVIWMCHNMEKFTLGPLITPKLETVIINGDDFGAANGLNDALLQHLAREKEKQQQKEMEEEIEGAGAPTSPPSLCPSLEGGRRFEIEEEPDSYFLNIIYDDVETCK